MSGRRSRIAGHRLTERERQILYAVSEGFGNQEIGNLLFIAERTVRTHCSNIIAKLGARNRTDATRIARETGLLDGAVAVAVKQPPRYTHRDGDTKPPTEPGYFWTECDGSTGTPGARGLLELAAAPWGEWRQRWWARDWEAYYPERLAGMRFWGPLAHPLDE